MVLDISYKLQLEKLVSRGLSDNTFEQMVLHQLEHLLPPSLLPQEWLFNSELSWSTEFSCQRQLKRDADFTVAWMLLILAANLILLGRVDLPLGSSACWSILGN